MVKKAEKTTKAAAKAPKKAAPKAAKAPKKAAVAVEKEVVTKTALIEQVAALAEQPKTVTADVINAAIDTIMDNVADGKQVQLKGFVTFDQRVNAARTGRNPQTGDAIEIAEQPVTTSTIGREFKRLVKEAFVAKK